MSLIDPDRDACIICLAMDCEHSDDERAAWAQALSEGKETPYLANDPGVVATTARKAKATQKQADNDLRFIMDDARGRRFMWELISRCGIYRSSYLSGRGVPEAVMFHEGERNIGLEIVNRISAVAPKGYELMHKENGTKS